MDNDQTTQDHQDPSQVSQETPDQDSILTTPKADQPAPTEAERDGRGQETQSEQPPAEAAVQQDESADEPPTQSSDQQEQSPGEVEASTPPTQRADVPQTGDEQWAAEDQRLRDKEAAQREHAQRTGGGEVREGEVQAQREEHIERTTTDRISDDSGLGRE